MAASAPSTSKLPQPKTGLRKPTAGPVSRLPTTRVTRRSASTPDLSKIGTKPPLGGGARSNFKLPVTGAGAARKPMNSTKPAVTSTATSATTRKRTAAVANGPSGASHGGKKPLLPNDSNKRKVAAWDTKGQLELANSKIELLKQEKENLRNAAAEVITLRDEMRNTKGQLELTNSKIELLKQEKENLRNAAAEVITLRDEMRISREMQKQTESELKEAKEKIKEIESLAKEKINENESLAAMNAELQNEVQSLSCKVEKYSDRNEQLLSDLADLNKQLEEAKCKIVTVTEENSREKSHKELLLRQIKEMEMKQKSYVDELYQLQSVRRTLHNQILDLKGNVRVFCRVRPPLESELHRSLCSITFSNETSLEIKSSASSSAATPYSTSKNKTDKYSFSYDKVFSPNAHQEEIYEELSQLVQSALDGYNVCIFAYGQTGSGKTYTMEGGADPQSRGMIPRAVETIFKSLQYQKELGWDFKIKVSFLEIYNEVIRDLLDLDSDAPHEVKMVDANSDDITVSNLTTEVVTDAAGLYKLVAIAQKNRFVAATVCNDYSSRSHSITQIKLEGVNSSRGANCKGTLNLIDLAGSERYRDENKDDRKAETVNINKSLASLSLVVLKLAAKSDHIPFRDSKLTHLLMPSLKGNSKTLMLVNISPFEDCFNESMSSLRFASRVSKVKVDSQRQIKNTLASCSSSKPAK